MCESVSLRVCTASSREFTNKDNLGVLLHFDNIGQYFLSSPVLLINHYIHLNLYTLLSILFLKKIYNSRINEERSLYCF